MAGVLTGRALTSELSCLFGQGVCGDLADGKLLERFLAGHPAEAEAAFTALVHRHGPMVLDVCRQALDDPHDAQDAFQATFLVLLRRAGSIRKRDSLASWLFGVAMRQAVRSRQARCRRGFHERQGGQIAARRANDGPCSAEQREALREQIARLPRRYQEAVVLCHLEGLSVAAAARRWDAPKGRCSHALPGAAIACGSVCSHAAWPCRRG